MSTNGTSGNSEIIVSGKDMFGATFSEKTHLLNRDEEEFSFSLFRPVTENQHIHVDFQPAEPVGNTPDHCIDGFIVNVKNRLDGMQTVEVRVGNGRRPLNGNSRLPRLSYR
jgi:hypothetical protein